MTTSQDSKPRRFTHMVQSGVIAIFVVSVLTILTVRHGWAVWGTILRLGWPVLVISVLIGILSGVVRWRWLQNSRLGRKVILFLNLGAVLLCGLVLMQRLALPDEWLGAFIAILQWGLVEVTESALKKAHTIESRA